MRCIGLDLGTSGIRGLLLADGAAVTCQTVAIGVGERADPHGLRAAVETVLRRLPLDGVGAIAVAGTSGTLVALDAGGEAIGPLSLYNERADAASLAAVAAAAPLDSPARGSTSPLARALMLARRVGAGLILHEADWIAGLLCGRLGVSDENNALKTGYDPAARCWPGWVAAAGVAAERLPQVQPPGTPIACVAPSTAARFGFPRTALVASGTTDGCASFLASGASIPGDGVTVLGSTLTIKLLSDRQISAPAFGVYSHRLWDNWLAGGASNTGGAVLAGYFNAGEIAELSARIDPARQTGLDYYPLPRPGERFPLDDPALQPRQSPRPADDALFLHGLFEGIASIEAEGYGLLARLGAPAIRQVSTLGGGAGNDAWTAIRARHLGVPVRAALDASAAHGAALLACRALHRDGQ